MGLKLTLVGLVLLAGCGGAQPDWERYDLAYNGIPYFRDDAPSFSRETFEQFADDTCGLGDDQLAAIYEAEGDGTSTYMLLAFACGDDVADRALNSSSEDVQSRQAIRGEYQRDWSSVERAKARIAEARAARCPDAEDDPTCP